MSDKVAIVTGANCGIGFRAAQMLCKHGVEVILACRSEEKGNDAVSRIKQEQNDAKAQFMQLDLASLKSVEQFSQSYLSLNKPLHILVNNAGLYMRDDNSPRLETSDGFELHWGTNHLGHFLLTSLLLNKLKQTGIPDSKARIVVLASMLHDKDCRGHRSKIVELDYEDPNLLKEGAFSGQQAYKNSKCANVMFTYKLAKMLENENVTINVMCPGFIPSTELGRQAGGFARFMLRWVLDGLLRPVLNWTRSLDHGAGLVFQLSTDPKHEGESGHYYSDYEAKESSAESRDPENQEKLWKLSEEMIKEKLASAKFDW